jgi:hypothetical protein
MADNTRKPTQRYLSGRVKIVNNAGLHTDRHLYVSPGEVEPNLGYVGEKSIPLADKYYQLITINNGTTYDRYWQEQPGLLPGGISVFDEGILVGSANSISKLNFVGTGVSATASGTISTITINPSSRVSVGTEPPGGVGQGDLWWDSDVGELYVYYEDGNSNQWVETSGGSETVTISDSAPSGANSGDLWWNSAGGVLNIYYDDGDSQQWIDATGGILDDLVNFWTSNSSGIHTLGNVGVGTTNPLASVTSLNTSVLAAGIVTAYKFYGDGSSLIGVGAGGTWAVDTVGINTVKNVGIGTTAKTGYKLYVEGDARVTGILTIGTSSITLDGTENQVNVGTGVTLHHTNGVQVGENAVHSTGITVNNVNVTGILTAASFSGDGTFLTGVGSTIAISDTAPSSPNIGDLWWESDSGDLKVYYNDGSSSQWVSANSSDTLVQISASAPSSSQPGDLWWDSETGNLHVYYEDADTSQWVTASNAIEGPQGSQGYQGVIGAQGTQGAQGYQGRQGVDGAQGSPGAQGSQGSQGYQGVQGAQGAQGYQGVQGVDGNEGTQGAQGYQGVQGADGAQGDVGAQGDPGVQGAQGAPGAQGNQGYQGYQGVQGEVGAQGVQGADGAQGSPGAQGNQGYQGRQGTTGAQGAQGAQGAPGSGVAAGSNTQVQYNSSGNFAGSSNLTFDGTNLTCGGTVTSNSDEKLKNNIKTIDNALEKVMNLRGVEFDYVGSGAHSIGFIAQEVEKVVPELVFGIDPKSVAYQNFVALLVEAVKEQNILINNLKERIEQLERDN